MFLLDSTWQHIAWKVDWQ